MMKRNVTGFILLALAVNSSPVAADDSSKNSMVVEFDPVAVSAAVNEPSINGFSSNQFGMTVDFPASQSLSTGPEFWGATYSAQGPADGTTSLRREDLFPGEKHRIETFRLKWNLTGWENPSSMSGRYFQFSYIYGRTNSRANRYTEGLDSTTNLPTDTTADTPESEPDLITDTRHSFGMELGNRWIYRGIAWSVGVSIAKIIDRKVAVSSSDENAQTDYESASNRLINSRMSLVPVPELSFGLGFAF